MLAKSKGSKIYKSIIIFHWVEKFEHLIDHSCVRVAAQVGHTERIRVATIHGDERRVRRHRG